MKQENEDIIKHKIESLDTLQGGIVFGREEAWEKLQGRMDGKTFKTFPIKYWLAAAAILLVMICIVPVYYYQAKPGIVSQSAVTPVPGVASPTQSAAIDNTPRKIDMLIDKPDLKEHKTRFANRYKTHELPATENIVIPEAIKENKVEDNNVAINAVRPAPNMKIPMKVVHINDIADNSGTQTDAPAIVMNNPSADINIHKMRVVHINELAAYTAQKSLEEKEQKYEHDIAANGPIHGINDMRNFIFHTGNKIKLNTQN